MWVIIVYHVTSAWTCVDSRDELLYDLEKLWTLRQWNPLKRNKFLILLYSQIPDFSKYSLNILVHVWPIKQTTHMEISFIHLMVSFSWAIMIVMKDMAPNVKVHRNISSSLMKQRPILMAKFFCIWSLAKVSWFFYCNRTKILLI